MKIRKAVKRLSKVESLLSAVIDGLQERSNGLGDLLESARENVIEARRTVAAGQAKKTMKLPVQVQASTSNSLNGEGQRRISIPAKKRRNNIKRKGAVVVTAPRLRKTA